MSGLAERARALGRFQTAADLGVTVQSTAGEETILNDHSTGPLTALGKEHA